MMNTRDVLEQTNRSQALKTIFLDRDGVINRKLPEGQYVTAWDDFELLPGIPEAIAAMNRLGLRVLVVSNQRGVALGLYSAADLEAIHHKLEGRLHDSGARLDGVYVCTHDKEECNCRKPLPGLFWQAQKDFPDIKPETSMIIGDSLSDIEFGRNLDLRTVFIEGNKEHRKEGAERAASIADFSFPNLPEAVKALFACAGSYALAPYEPKWL